MKERAVASIVVLVTIAVLVALTPVLVTGCGVEQQPGDVVEQFYVLLTERKFSEAYALLASDSRLRKTFTEDMFVSKMETETPRDSAVTAFEVVEENEEEGGDRMRLKCSVTIQEGDMEPQANTLEVELVQEDGQWKINQ